MLLNEFRIRVADVLIDIRCRYEGVSKLCREYISDEKGVADISVYVSEEKIDKELTQSGNSHTREYCETVCVYREIAEKLPSLERFVFHGAAVTICGRGVIFAAPSGVGKSTHVRLLKECFGDKVTVINGDKPIVGETDGAFLIYGSPWSGKERWNCNASAKLNYVCLVRRSEKNRIFEIDPEEYFDEIINQIYVPRDGSALLKTFDVLNDISKKVKFYLLECNISDEAAHLSYDTFSK